MNLIPETWKDVPGYAGAYRVSSWGAVMSMRNGRRLQPYLHHEGYPRVDLYRAGKRKKFFVHRLVALAFLGPRRRNQVVDHLNALRWDNRPENLEYVTQKRNVRRLYARRNSLLLSQKGAQHGN